LQFCVNIAFHLIPAATSFVCALCYFATVVEQIKIDLYL